VITLPPTLTLLGPPLYDRGSGCTGATTIDCSLDYLPNGGSTVVRFATRVSGSGAQTLTATASADRDSDPSNNTASVTIQVGTPTTLPPPPPPLPAPVLKQVDARTLSGVRRAAGETVDGKFTTNEPLHLTLSVTRLGSSRRLAVLKGTRVSGVTARAPGTVLKSSVARAGTVAFHVVLRSGALVRGKTYVVHIAATNARGKTTALGIRFRA
jgi:hypothetical protein